MKNITTKIAETISASLLILIISSGITNADKSGIIKIPIHNWSSQLVGAKVIGNLLEMVGEKVEYVPSDSQAVYKSMADGDIDIVHEIWEDAFDEAYEKAKASGGIEEILTHDAITRLDWWYPEYVEKVCPGLPDWKALNMCSAKFAREGSKGKGVFISGSPDWLKHDEEKIDALKMNFIVEYVGSAGAIWTELDAAAKENKPIVIFNWSPNFTGEKYKGKFVEFPKYNPKCVNDKTWGINPDALYDCGNQSKGYLKLAVNSDFKKNHPKAYKIVKQMNFSESDLNKMSNYVDTDGLDISTAAKQWLKDHKKKWSKWIENE